MNTANELLSTYWVLVVLTALVIISVNSVVVLYRVLFMLLFLVFANLFQAGHTLCASRTFSILINFNVIQLRFHAWRNLLYTFWMVCVAYCMVLILLIYTYQFHGIPQLYTEYLYVTPEV